MNALVVYDSMFGNTEKIAQSIATGLGPEAKLARPSNVEQADLQNLDLLVVGSPVHGGRASENLQKWFAELSDSALTGVRVAAFDTRFEKNTHGLGLKLVMNVIGFAAGRIANLLSQKGGTLALDPEGFIVEDKEGPLKAGELERAQAWGEALAAAVA